MMAPKPAVDPARLLQLVTAINTHDPIKIQYRVNQFVSIFYLLLSYISEKILWESNETYQ